MRLNVYIAKSGISSRRGADGLIASGAVSVNGEVTLKPYVEVGDSDRVVVRGKKLDQKDNVYLAFHKPCGVTATKKDKFAQETILDYLPKKFHNLFPVGRLDRDSNGLLLLTNDGQACYCLTHPKFMVEKEYILRLDGLLSSSDCLKAKKGMVDGIDLLKVKQIVIISKDSATTMCRVVICEGKNRHLRRLFKALGFGVLALARVRIGTLKLGGIRPGEYNILSKQSVYKNILLGLKKDKTMIG